MRIAIQKLSGELHGDRDQSRVAEPPQVRPLAPSRAGEYPKWKYHPMQAREGIVVPNREEEVALGEGWLDSPDYQDYGEEPTPDED